VRVVVGKIEGVQSVTVSLKRGVATIQFAPSNRVTIARIREAVRSNGFTAREAEVRVAGLLAERGDSLTLVVPGSNDVFLLQDAPGSPGVIAEVRREGDGTRVVLTGRVPSPAKGVKGPERLLVRSLTAVEERRR
jgi:copper chaperone CopZ